ncbi:MAG: hypothetical protein HZB51_23285 [Chloroflexi bacterium]|nr:hypothetical protein [Chloroflexota bacterium]
MLAKKHISVIIVLLLMVIATAMIAPSVSAQGRTPPTLTPTATATKVPPTAVKVVPTATAVPPTAVKVAPTATSVPPTATKVPPTATKVPTATPAPKKPLVVNACATCQTWSSSITYYTSSATDSVSGLSITYYNGATTYIAGPLSLPAHKAGSLNIGSTSVPAGFAGSAVLTSDVPIVATYVQIANAPENVNFPRMMYSAFTADVGGSTFYVPTILNSAFGTTSRVGIQNISDATISANLRFYAVGSVSPTLNVTKTILSQASFVFLASDAATLGGGGLPAGFNGSLVISASGGTAPKVVASSEETADAGRGATAFEGLASGANKFYMPTMLCNFGANSATSNYAIQNTSLVSTANVTISYYNTSGGLITTSPSLPVGAANKISRNPCTDGVPNGTSGSAVINATGAPIIAIGKVAGTDGLKTAFTGISTGSTKVAAAYIRWAADTTTDFRSNIAIMNVGTSNATNIVAKYYDNAGNVYTENVATGANPLGSLIKRNTNPTTAGAPVGFGITPAFGGAVEITSDQPIAVVIRNAKDVSPALDSGTITKFGEDYNAVTVP